METSVETDAPTLRLQKLLTISVLSAALVLFQILLTRIFSVVFLSHLGFAAVSIGMLGLATAGVRVYTWRHKFSQTSAPADIARATALFSGTLIICTFLLSRLGANLAAFSWQVSTQLCLIYVAAVVPFYFGGLALSLILTHGQANFPKLYAADLVGAGLGGTLALPLLPLFGGPGAIIFVALLVGAVAFVIAPTSAPRLRTTGLALSSVCALLLALDNSHHVLHLKRPNGVANIEPYFEKWNAFSRVAVYRVPAGPWALGPKFKGRVAETPMISIDSSAATSVALANDIEGSKYLAYELTSVAYSAAPRHNALVIGAGGGRDVLTALMFGVAHVDAVEINPIIVNELMNDEFDEISGHLYQNPNVTVEIGDGRSYVSRSNKNFDVIQLSLVDTWAATAAGAFALSENNLYTVEAIRDYIRHLSPDGILTIARWSGPDMWRLLGEIHEACKQLGIDDMAAHVAMLETPGQGQLVTNLLFRRSAMDAGTLAALQEQIDKAGYTWLLNPTDDSLGDSITAKIVHSSDPGREASQVSGTDLTPSVDDWPFFFYRPAEQFWSRLANAPSLLVTSPHYLLVGLLLLSSMMSILCIFVPLARSNQVASLAAHRGSVLAVAPYYAAIGLGFMFVEISLMQRFVLYLGHPTYALTVVLAALLSGAGLGSLGASRFAAWILHSSNRIGLVAAVVVIVLLGSGALQPWWISLTQAWTLPARVAVTLVMLTPLAISLGTLMPCAMTCLNAGAPELVPWAWGLNGFASVVGSCAAAYSAMSLGFTHTFQIGALLYAIAGGMALCGAFEFHRSSASHGLVTPSFRDHVQSSSQD